MNLMPKTKFQTRQQYISKTGKRISRGAWERRNRAYAVYKALTFEGKPKMQVIDFEWHPGEKCPDGTRKRGPIRLDKHAKAKPIVRLCVTHVLLPDTAKHNRKVGINDRWDEQSKRARYHGKPLAITR